MRNSYPIIGNCNFESRDDDAGKVVHGARLAVEAGNFCWHGPLMAALEDLDETLGRLAEKGDPASVDECERAEHAVVDAWFEADGGAK